LWEVWLFKENGKTNEQPVLCVLLTGKILKKNQRKPVIDPKLNEILREFSQSDDSSPVWNLVKRLLF